MTLPRITYKISIPEHWQREMLKEIRTNLGETQRSIGCAIGMTKGNVSHIENGKQSLSVEKAKRLIEYAKTKGVTVTLEQIYGASK